MDRSSLDPDSDTRALAWHQSHGEPIDDLSALAFHLRARAVLGKTLARLEAAGVEALVVKGALLAHTLYARAIDRPIRDVDLRVRPRDLDRATGALVAAGARRLVASRVYRNAVLSFERVELDLETSVGPPFVCALGIDAMLARAERTSAGLGFPHARPELHDHALLLCVNLFKDHVVDLPRWRFRDLELVARAPAFDARRLATVASEAHCRTIVHVVARRLARACDDPRWAEVARAIPPARPGYAARVLAVLEGGRPLSPLAFRFDVRAASDDPARRVAALGAVALHELELRLE